MTGEKLLNDWISELAGSITDPLIVYPSPWMDSLPEDIKKQVPIERMIMLMRHQKGDIEAMTATDAEALLYLYPASLEAPFSETWTQVYIYLGAKVCGGMGRDVPEDLKGVVLTKYQQDHLDRLKAWIYSRRVAARKEKDRAQRKEEKARAKEEAPDVIQHQFDLGE